MNNIGFTVLSHSDPKQLQRLTRCLDVLYEPVAIACHHDFGRCQMNSISFPRSVMFVQPHMSTRWGTMSIVLAGLSTLRLLYRVADPDWFVMLSASDYPVKEPHIVVGELYDSRSDVFLDHRELLDLRMEVKRPITGYAQPEWAVMAFQRYVATVDPVRYGYPVGSRLRCFAGELWLTANRRAAHVLLNATAAPNSPVLQYFSRCPVPDEAVYHTILCNDSRLTVCSNNYRYTDWSGAGDHPKTLGITDLPGILASGAHFARKFRGNDDAVLRHLDEHLGVPVTNASRLKSEPDLWQQG